MYIYAANLMAIQGKWHNGDDFLEYCHYKMLNYHDDDDCYFSFNFLKWMHSLLISEINNQGRNFIQTTINKLSFILVSILKKII